MAISLTNPLTSDSLNTGLLAWYLSAAGYTSGSTWTNLVSGGNNGALTNGPAFSGATRPGGFGSPLLLDGSNDYVETSIVLPTTNFTFMCWGNSAATGFGNRILGNADSSGGLNGADIIWGAAAANQLFAVIRGGSAGDISNKTAASLATGWHHVALTMHSTNGGVLYYDGTAIGTTAGTTIASSLPFRIGRDGNASDAFNGSVDSVKVFNRALTSTEIAREVTIAPLGYPGVLQLTPQPYYERLLGAAA